MQSCQINLCWLINWKDKFTLEHWSLPRTSLVGCLWEHIPSFSTLKKLQKAGDDLGVWFMQERRELSADPSDPWREDFVLHQKISQCTWITRLSIKIKCQRTRQHIRCDPSLRGDSDEHQLLALMAWATKGPAVFPSTQSLFVPPMQRCARLWETLANKPSPVPSLRDLRAQDGGTR